MVVNTGLNVPGPGTVREWSTGWGGGLLPASLFPLSSALALGGPRWTSCLRDWEDSADPGQAEPGMQLRQGGLSVLSQLRSALQGAVNPKVMQARDWESDCFLSFFDWCLESDSLLKQQSV